MAGSVVGFFGARGLDLGQLVRRLLGHRQGQPFSLHIGPRTIAAIHEHVIGVAAAGVVPREGAGMVNIGRGDGIALAIVEPGIPRIVDGRLVGADLVLEHGDFRRERATSVHRLLVNPVTAVRAVAVEQIQVAVGELDPLRVGAERRDVLHCFPRGDVAGLLGDYVGQPALAWRAELILTVGRIAAVGSENEMDVTLTIHDQGRAAVIVEFARVHLIG